MSVRQCLLVKKSGFLLKCTKESDDSYKYGIKCYNTSYIKLVRNFQAAASKIPHGNDKDFFSSKKV